MKTVKVQTNKNGSLHLTGPVELIDADGTVIKTSDEFWLCRCGQSKNKPFCDGAHKTIGFKG